MTKKDRWINVKYINKSNILKYRNLNKNEKRGYDYMIKEYAGFALPALAIIGATGEISQQYIDSVLIIGIVIIIISSLLWSYLYSKRLHFLFSTFFGAAYALWGFAYLANGQIWSNFIAVGYFLICLFTMKLTIEDMADETY